MVGTWWVDVPLYPAPVAAGLSRRGTISRPSKSGHASVRLWHIADINADDE